MLSDFSSLFWKWFRSSSNMYFLNCTVYCESCTVGIADEMIKCQLCQSPHPRGLPKVCLEFANFLQEQFPKEYAIGRDAVQLKQVDLKHGRQTTSTSEYLVNSLHFNNYNYMDCRLCIPVIFIFGLYEKLVLSS